MRAIFIFAALVLAATTASAQTTFFTDSRGRSAGSADRFGDITFSMTPKAARLDHPCVSGTRLFITGRMASLRGRA